MNNSYLNKSFLLFITGAVAACSSTDKKSYQPNILWIVADDMGP